jgi:hypothetical protein
VNGLATPKPTGWTYPHCPWGLFGHPQAKWGWPRLLGVVSTSPILLLGGDSATALAKPPPYFFFLLIFKLFYIFIIF